MRMQGESKVSGVNQGNEGGWLVEDFLVLPQGFRNFPSVFYERGGVFSAHGLFISD